MEMSQIHIEGGGLKSAKCHVLFEWPLICKYSFTISPSQYNIIIDFYSFSEDVRTYTS
jgi:hypothetical protein